MDDVIAAAATVKYSFDCYEYRYREIHFCTKMEDVNIGRFIVYQTFFIH
jgi:hypothetical protein